MFERILNILDLGIHVVNQHGVTIFYNDKMAEIDGLSREHVLGKNILELYPSLSAESSTLLATIKNGQACEPRVQSYTNGLGQRVTTVNQTIPIIQNGVLDGAIEMSRDITQLVHLNERLLDLREQTVRLNALADKKNVKSTAMDAATYEFADLVGQHPLFLEAITRAKKAARTDANVLVYGPTGSGKELLAHSIHNASTRKTKPFIAQNCAAMPRELMEGILFGTSRGAFTGAVDRAGLFEQADGGTLFLDEIHLLDITLQAKLLRVLQDGRIRRIGATYESAVDVRIIAAMNVQPSIALERGMIRSDIYYRLNVLSIELPSLHERSGDVTLLAQHFIRVLNERYGLSVQSCSNEVWTMLEAHHWPGNVRELRHVMESAMLMMEPNQLLIEQNDLPTHIKNTNPDDLPPKRWTK